MILTDQEIKNLLRERGYDVPIMVIRTWPQHMPYSVQRNKRTVIRWLLHKDGSRGRKANFPQWIAPFDINIQRIAQRQTQALYLTPRLRRTA